MAANIHTHTHTHTLSLLCQTRTANERGDRTAEPQECPYRLLSDRGGCHAYGSNRARKSRAQTFPFPTFPARRIQTSKSAGQKRIVTDKHAIQPLVNYADFFPQHAGRDRERKRDRERENTCPSISCLRCVMALTIQPFLRTDNQKRPLRR